MKASQISIEREEYNFYVNITQDDPVLTYARFQERKRKQQDEIRQKFPDRFVNKETP